MIASRSAPSLWCSNRSMATRPIIRALHSAAAKPARPAATDQGPDLRHSKAPVSPALFCCRLAWLGFVAVGGRLVRRRRRFLRRLVTNSLLGFGFGFGLRFGFGRDLTRRRLLGPFRRQQRSNLRQRIPDVPLADPVVVAPLRQVEMDMVLVVPVRAGAEHGRKTRAD